MQKRVGPHRPAAAESCVARRLGRSVLAVVIASAYSRSGAAVQQHNGNGTVGWRLAVESSKAPLWLQASRTRGGTAFRGSIYLARQTRCGGGGGIRDRNVAEQLHLTAVVCGEPAWDTPMG